MGLVHSDQSKFFQQDGRVFPEDVPTKAACFTLLGKAPRALASKDFGSCSSHARQAERRQQTTFDDLPLEIQVVAPTGKLAKLLTRQWLARYMLTVQVASRPAEDYVFSLLHLHTHTHMHTQTHTHTHTRTHTHTPL